MRALVCTEFGPVSEPPGLGGPGSRPRRRRGAGPRGGGRPQLPGRPDGPGEVPGPAAAPLRPRHGARRRGRGGGQGRRRLRPGDPVMADHRHRRLRRALRGARRAGAPPPGVARLRPRRRLAAHLRHHAPRARGPGPAPARRDAARARRRRRGGNRGRRDRQAPRRAGHRRRLLGGPARGLPPARRRLHHRLLHRGPARAREGDHPGTRRRRGLRPGGRRPLRGGAALHRLGRALPGDRLRLRRDPPHPAQPGAAQRPLHPGRLLGRLVPPRAPQERRRALPHRRLDLRGAPLAGGERPPRPGRRPRSPRGPALPRRAHGKLVVLPGAP